MKLETHLHTAGSACADAGAEYIAKTYKDFGYDGVVVTNHYNKVSYESWKGTTHKQKTDTYFSFIDDMKKECSKYGLKVFWGTEVCVSVPQGGHSEYVLLGEDKDFLYNNKPLFLYTQRELFDLANKNGIFMYKVHPFRDGEFTGDPKYMHGAEYFNGHYHHNNHNDLAEKFCNDNNLIKMSGTDFHHVNQPATAGIVVSDDIKNERELVHAIKKGEYSLIMNDELREKTYRAYKSGKIV